MATYFAVPSDYAALAFGQTVNGVVLFTPNVNGVALDTSASPPLGWVTTPTVGAIVNGNLQTSIASSSPVYLQAQTSDLNLSGTLQYATSLQVTVGGVNVPVPGFLFNAQTPRATSDAGITINTTTLTSATADFTSADVGAVVTVAGAIASGTSGTITTIVSVTNSTTAVLSSEATATVSGAALTICQSIDLITVTPATSTVAFGEVSPTTFGTELVTSANAAAVISLLGLGGGQDTYLGTSANQTAMLALTGVEGNWTIRTDTTPNTVWYLTGSPASTLGSWTELPTQLLTSVFGRTGAVVAASGDYTPYQVGALPTGGVVSLDDPRWGSGLTDDQKLAAAMTYAAAQTHIPAIQFPARDVTLNTGGLTPYSGMKFLAPAGADGSKDLEIGSGGVLSNHRVILNVGSDTSSLFVQTSNVYDINISNLAFQGGNTTSQFWDTNGYVLWASAWHALTFYGMCHVLGSPTHYASIDQCVFTGHWQVISGYDTQFTIGGSDNDLWMAGLCNLGSSQTVGAGVYNMILNNMAKTRIGYVYNTVNTGWKGLHCTGSVTTLGGVSFHGGTIEGQSQASPSTAQVVDVDGTGIYSFFGTMFNQVASGAVGAINQSGGQIDLYSPSYLRATAAAQTQPLLYQTAGVANIFSAASATSGEICYATWASGKTDALQLGSVWANGTHVGVTGTLAPCQAMTNGAETFTIASGTVTEITGLTINSGTYTPAVGDHLLIPNAPASTGAGTVDTFTTEPGNGVYAVISLAGGNIALARYAHMSGTVQPTGLQIWVEAFGGWGASALCIVSTPVSTDTAFTWGTTSLAFTMLMGASSAGLFNTLKLSGAHTATVQTNSAATGSTTITLPATTDTLMGRATVDTPTNKTISAPANAITLLNRILETGSTYTALSNDLVACNPSGAMTVTLPTAPVNGTLVGIKNLTTAPYVITYQTGGSDVFNIASGATSGTLVGHGQGVLLEYDATSLVWTIISDDLPLSFTDARYVQQTSASSTPTGGDVAEWDTNVNLSANNFIDSYTTTATAAGTTTLTVASAATQVFTGTSTQTVKLPTTSVAAGFKQRVVNLSTGAVTVQSSGGNAILVIGTGGSAEFRAEVATPTTAANWFAFIGAGSPQQVGAYWTPSVYVTGNWYCCNSQTSANTPATFTQNDVRVSPWVVMSPITVTGLGAESTALGDINSVFHIGIWADGGVGTGPGALVADAGSISTGTSNSGTVPTISSTFGVNGITGLSIVLMPGLYWVGGCFQTSNGTPVSPTMRTITSTGGTTQVPIPLGSSLPPTGGADNGWHQTGVTGALGAFTPSLSGTNAVRIIFKC